MREEAGVFNPLHSHTVYIQHAAVSCDKRLTFRAVNMAYYLLPLQLHLARSP